MKRLLKHLLSPTIPPRPHEAGAGISPSVADDPIPAIRRGPAPDRHRVRWVVGALVILFVLLAPWGGPCDRRTRPADPTTSRLAAIYGPERGSQPGLHGSDHGGGIPGMALDILDDEDDGNEFEGRLSFGHSQGLTPRSPGVLGPIVCDSHHDDSGRSARSAFLRC